MDSYDFVLNFTVLCPLPRQQKKTQDIALAVQGQTGCERLNTVLIIEIHVLELMILHNIFSLLAQNAGIHLFNSQL